MNEQLKQFVELNSDLLDDQHSALYFICPDHLKPELFTLFKDCDIDFKPSIHYIAPHGIIQRGLEMNQLFKRNQ